MNYEKIIDKLENKNYDFNGTGKSIPYIGWFWRTTNLQNDCVHIGKTPGGYELDTYYKGFVGVMENNKWGHPERQLSMDECQIFKSLLCLVDADKYSKESATTLWDWFQTLTVETPDGK